MVDTAICHDDDDQLMNTTWSKTEVGQKLAEWISISCHLPFFRCSARHRRDELRPAQYAEVESWQLAMASDGWTDHSNKHYFAN
ncbi:hypothetical protein Ciccas_004280 [Cichlidogyrus casuarinus]|uniref:Uncharacterized protein n=1 Tax=Cichlidogyrus casuarinus TaxID=1844966 RepID=A0ABD2QBW9_9PLAT